MKIVNNNYKSINKYINKYKIIFSYMVKIQIYRLIINKHVFGLNLNKSYKKKKNKNYYYYYKDIKLIYNNYLH